MGCWMPHSFAHYVGVSYFRSVSNTLVGAWSSGFTKVGGGGVGVREGEVGKGVTERKCCGCHVAALLRYLITKELCVLRHTLFSFRGPDNIVLAPHRAGEKLLFCN